MQHYQNARKILLLFAFLLFICDISSAAPNILDGITEGYETVSKSWVGRVEPIARSLFWKLAAIEFAWSTIVWAMQQEHVQSFTTALTKKIIGIGFFYALLINAPEWINAIVQGFVKTGQTATGLPSLTPSAVLDRGVDVGVSVLNAVHFTGVLDTIAAAILAGWTALFIVIAFAIIAGQLLVALVESYIVISAGIIFLGFGGSRWTTDLAQKYISYAVATGVKLFVLYLIIGVAMEVSSNWTDILVATKPGTWEIVNPFIDVVPNWGTMFMMLAASILLVFLAFQIPNTAAGMLAGAPSLTAGAAASTGAAVGAGVIAGGGRAISAATSAAQGGVGSAAGIGKAIQAGRAGSSTPSAGLKTAAGGGREAAATASRSVQGLSSGGGSSGSSAAANRQTMTAATEGKSAPGAGAVPQVSPPGAGGSGGAGRAPDRLSGESSLGSTAPNPTALNVSGSGKSADGAAHAAPAPEASAVPQFSSASASSDAPRQMFEGIEQVRPPQIPSDAAPTVGANFRTDLGND